jgi:hypothetical protein
MFKVEVTGEMSCPNCNATAQTIIQKRKPTNQFWEFVMRCPKCKIQIPITDENGYGPLLHDENKNAFDQRRILMKRYDEAETPVERGRIMMLVRAIDAREKHWVQSL